jgi:hypothetical protein
MKKKIKIGYEDIIINVINFETEDKKDDNVLGEYDSSNAKIDIQKEQNARSEANTLLHEVIHACVYQTGLNSQGNLLSKEENEEISTSGRETQNFTTTTLACTVIRSLPFPFPISRTPFRGPRF